MRIDARSCMNVFGTSDSNIIIYDSRCGMSDVAFCTALPIGGISCLDISETTRANNFKIHRDVSLNSLYISTGNDVINCFRSATIRSNVLIFGHVRFAISR